MADNIVDLSQQVEMLQRPKFPCLRSTDPSLFGSVLLNAHLLRASATEWVPKSVEEYNQDSLKGNRGRKDKKRQKYSRGKWRLHYTQPIVYSRDCKTDWVSGCRKANMFKPCNLQSANLQTGHVI